MSVINYEVLAFPDQPVAVISGAGDNVPLADISKDTHAVRTRREGTDSGTQSPIPEIRIHGSVDEPYQDDPETARMDEDEMRRANQDVMQMQRRMMDGE